jgi:general secretion pathway protein E/type IV pilus assembly protein PilB
LLRRVCASSFEEYQPDPAECVMLGLDPEQAATTTLRRGVPADVNFHTGYSGRSGVFEVLSVDSELRMGILAEKSAKELRALLIQRGLLTLDQAAIRKVRAGITTLEEMHRVLMQD